MRLIEASMQSTLPTVLEQLQQILFLFTTY